MRRAIILALFGGSLFVLAACMPDETECYRDEDCGSDGWCPDGRPAPTCSHGCVGPLSGDPGTCEPRFSRGRICRVEGHPTIDGQSMCAEGLVCHYGFDPPRCEPPSGLGAVCGASTDCGAGDSYDDDDPICATSQPLGAASSGYLGSGICAPAHSVASGYSCESHRHCEEGLGCIQRVCRPPGGDGDPCVGSYSMPAGMPKCSAGHYCDSDDRLCHALGVAGDLCIFEGSCADELICTHATKPRTCALPGGLDDACIRNPDCSKELTCIDERCVPPSGEGGRCLVDTHCLADLLCIFEICRPLGRVGDPCKYLEHCTDGLVCTEEQRCERPRPAGEICVWHIECESRSCSAGRCN